MALRRIAQLAALSALVLAGCRTEPTSAPPTYTGEPVQLGPADAGGLDHDAEPPAPPPGGRKVRAYRDGQVSEITEPEALAAGLTVIDLSNFWVPFIFSEKDGPDTPRLENEFRPIYRKLANDWPFESRTRAEARQVVERRIERARQAKILELREQGMSEERIRKELGLDEPDAAAADEDAGAEGPDGGLPEGGPGEEEHYLEVYGILPSLSVLRKRSLEEVRRSCYDEVDFDAIRRFDGFVAYKSNETADAEAKKGKAYSRRLREAMAKLELDDPLALIEHPKNKLSGGLIRIGMRYEALVAAQEQLACEGLFADENALRYYRRGALDWKTHQALSAFERKNRIFAWGFFGDETLQALKKTPRERLYDTFVRVLAERLIDGTGIIEDGSAVDLEGNKAVYKDEHGVEHAVPNLVAEVTAHALKHMDLGSPDKVIAFLEAHDDDAFDRFWVALPLPELPPYYGEQMDLHAVIDRGDVWYDYPFDEEGRRRGGFRKRMPKTTMFVKWREQDIPLVTMNTTIGSWRTELGADGYEYYAYKNSDVGPRVWKEIFAGPVWLPPDTTPVKDLFKTVRYRGRLVKVPNYDEFGPWYASAYGLVAAFHVREVERPSGKILYIDNGIRSHGSVDYNSILRRYSHGCHRLYNHLAIRLFDFVLRHRKFNRLGKLSAGYSRKVELDDEVFFINIDSRGYRYELVDAVPIEVLRGRVRGKQRSPIEHYMPKPGVEYGPDAQLLPEGWGKPADPDAGVEPAGGAAEEPATAGPDKQAVSDGSDRSDRSDGGAQ
jgi:hypothetical protein